MTVALRKPTPDKARTGPAIPAVLNAIEEIGRTFTATLRLEPVLDRIIDEAVALASGDAGSIMLVSEDRRELVVTAARGPRANIILGARQPVDASVAGRAIREGTLILKGRVEHRGSGGPGQPRDVSRSLVIPLHVTARLVGVLNVNTETERDELPGPTVTLMGILANQAAILIEHSRMFEELALKERRLELFVDRFLRLQAEQRDGPDLTTDRLHNLLGDVMRKTVEEFTAGSKQMIASVPDASHPLSAREQEVLALIVEGLTNKEIGRRLNLSPDTVKNHVVHIIEKLGVSDRTQAAVMAIRMGLIK
ncbi:MAG: LuxR C-terminal-related transcriptional regulator [Chloroflexota bacterium]